MIEGPGTRPFSFVLSPRGMTPGEFAAAKAHFFLSSSEDGRFRYLGGAVPLPAALNRRAQQLARRAVESVAGLFGYVGVDVGLAPSPEDDVVIEINPRLTTSYVGLRRLARFNLADALLAVTTGSPLPRPEWHEGPVRFSAAP